MEFLYNLYVTILTKTQNWSQFNNFPKCTHFFLSNMFVTTVRKNRISPDFILYILTFEKNYDFIESRKKKRKR